MSRPIAKLADAFAYPPRAMRLERAAAYLDMSPSSFLRMVDDGLLPKPIKIKGLVVWDRLDLDAAFDSLKEPTQSSQVNSMHKLLGIQS